MASINLVWLALLVWGACGVVIYAGRKLWSQETTLRVHLVAAPIFAFLAAACHAELAPAFDPLLRTAALVGIIAALDAFVIAPFAERSYAMFRSLMGTWLPFLAIFARRSVALVTPVRGLQATSAPGGIGPSRQVARPLPLPIV